MQVHSQRDIECETQNKDVSGFQNQASLSVFLRRIICGCTYSSSESIEVSEAGPATLQAQCGWSWVDTGYSRWHLSSRCAELLTGFCSVGSAPLEKQLLGQSVPQLLLQGASSVQRQRKWNWAHWSLSGAILQLQWSATGLTKSTCSEALRNAVPLIVSYLVVILEYNVLIVSLIAKSHCTIPLSTS